MFAISMIHKTGGDKIVLGRTIAECKDSARKMCSFFPSSYLMCTVPYAVYKNKDGIYNVSVPAMIRKDIGLELRLILSDLI